MKEGKTWPKTSAFACKRNPKLTNVPRTTRIQNAASKGYRFRRNGGKE